VSQTKVPNSIFSLFIKSGNAKSGSHLRAWMRSSG